MRVLHLIQKPQFRGAELFACQLSNSLIALGHQPVLMSLFKGDAKLPFRGEVRQLDLPEKASFFDFHGFKKLAGLIAETNPDVVQANAGDTLRYAVLSKWMYGWKQPIVFRNASTVSLYIKSLPVKWFYRMLYRKTDYIVSVSKSSREDFLNLFPFAKNKIDSVPIGIDLDVQVAGQSPYPDDRPRLVHVGGFTFEKNHAGIVRIFEALSRDFPQLQLWLVGDGPLRGAVEEKVELTGLKDRVFFTGFVGNPMDYIAHADVLVLPSIIEGLPGVILEAQYCKTPVVAYDVGGISEIVMNSETGWLVRKGDEKGFVEAVEEVLKLGKEGVSDVLERAYQKVTEEYDNREVARRFLEIYERVSETAKHKRRKGCKS